MTHMNSESIESFFRRTFKEKGRVSRIEIIKYQVEKEQARSSSGGLAHPGGIRGIAYEAALAFDLFCYDKMSKGLIYPEHWRSQLEHALEVDEEWWFSSDEGPVFDGKGDTGAAERVLGSAQGSLPPWHGKSEKEIAGNHDWTVCLKLFASNEYFDDLDRLINQLNQLTDFDSTTYIANNFFADDEPPGVEFR
jgi:hypothetical protein